MNYRTMPMNLLPNGLTLLQQNPDCAARLEPEAKDHGWLYTRGADGQWVTLRQLSAAEIETAYDRVTCGGGLPGDPNGEHAALAVEVLVRKYEGAMLRETLREALTEAYMMGAQNILGRL